MAACRRLLATGPIPGCSTRPPNHLPLSKRTRTAADLGRYNGGVSPSVSPGAVMSGIRIPISAVLRPDLRRLSERPSAEPSSRRRFTSLTSSSETFPRGRFIYELLFMWGGLLAPIN